MGFRLLLAGRPKSGKTGALGALVNAGYTLRYLNADDNTEPLFAYSDKAAHARLRANVVDCVDDFRFDEAGDLVVNGAQGLKAWATIRGSLAKWPADGSDPAKWGRRDILVIDSLTEVAKSLARRQLTLDNRQKRRYSYHDYSRVQAQVDALMTYLKSRLPVAGLIVVCHLQLVGPDLAMPSEIENDALVEEIMRQKLRGADNVSWRLAPITFGKQQANTLAGHFTGSIYAKSIEGRGRVLLTQPEDGFDAGVPIPGLARELKLESGLAKIFDLMVGAPKPAPTKAEEKRR